ncbi:hypothetical protein EUTSA_v10025491mg [Eutrema salsugineum]|uniref:Glycosyltransferase n=2 Tax=Eutrema TaxID=98005 RepID=V4P716_EUTSA|nr:uncharacterized protein At4g15970 [Eutrema salsugineum]ESQ55371.1 hypothetical protein EUTSA_v10025491mg [Eutrema salsugineum]BAJ34335.1 unnamed protein product [Eutrema halophilum]
MKSTNGESSSLGYKFAGVNMDDGKSKPPVIYSDGFFGGRDVIKVVLLVATVTLSCLLFYKSANNPLNMVSPWKSDCYSSKIINETSLEMVQKKKPVSELERVLMNAAMEDNTVIITALNQAWAEPNSTFDVFRESFKAGLGTERLLKHVIAVCLDNKAYDRCVEVHPHCYLINATDSDQLSGPNRFMTPGYLKLIWRRMDLHRQVLGLGYNFIFTDADILWLRDPFPRFFPDADFQITCDDYNGKPSDKNNHVNSGFTYVKANNKTLNFYKYWIRSSRKFPGKHDQDVFNLIKNKHFIEKLGIKMRFFDTVYFGGFCQPSRDINVVNTMHANCCIGLDNKVNNLKAALEDWKLYVSLNTTVSETKWNIPPRCGY